MNILGGNACASHKLLCQTASINLGWKSLENKALLLVFFFFFYQIKGEIFHSTQIFKVDTI